MTRTTARLAAWSLIAGTIIATVGYLAGFLFNGNGDDRFAGSSWSSWYTVALLGNALVVIGLPALFVAQQGRSPRLTMVGYVGTMLALIVLNLGEGVVESFVKPYLANHGGIPASDVSGLDLYETPGLLGMLIGLVCLGIAVLRAGALPKWVGVVFILAPVVGVAGLPGIAGLVADFLAFAGFLAVGVLVLRSDRTVTSSEQVLVTTALH